MMASVAEFYGWTHDYIISLDVSEFRTYWLAITVIEARRAQFALQVADFPHMKQGSRSKLHQQLSRMQKSMIQTEESEKELSIEELDKKLRSILG